MRGNALAQGGAGDRIIAVAHLFAVRLKLFVERFAFGYDAGVLGEGKFERVENVLSIPEEIAFEPLPEIKDGDFIVEGGEEGALLFRVDGKKVQPLAVFAEILALPFRKIQCKPRFA